MANYRIDVHRGLVTVTGTFSGKQRSNLISLEGPALEDCHDATAAAVETLIDFGFPWGGSLRCEMYFIGVVEGMPCSPCAGNVQYGIRLTAETGFGDTDTTDIYILVTPAPAGSPSGDYGTDVTASFSGTIEVTFQLETLMTPTIGGMPTYAGAESIDSPPQTDVTLYERFVPGQMVSMEICADVAFSVSSPVGQPGGQDLDQSGCASASDTISTDVPLAGYQVTTSADLVTVQRDSAGASANVEGWFGETTRPTLECTANAGGASGTALVTGYGVSVSISASGDCQVGYGSAINNAAPDRKFSISGMVRRMEDAYPDAILEIFDGTAYQEVTANSGGVFTLEDTQLLYSGDVSIHVGDEDDPFDPLSDSCSDSDSLNEWGSLHVRLKPAWKTSEDIELPLWPVLFRAFPAYDVFDLEQASERQVLSAYSGSGPSDISRTISLANGADTDLDGTDWLGFSLRGYAYLRLRVKADDASSPFAVQIGSKTWTKDKAGSNLIAGTSFANFEIDLLCPDGGESDGKDSRYPYASSGPIVVDDTDLFGVSNATSIVLTNLASTDYDVDSVKLVRDDHSNATVLNGFNNFVPAVVGDTSQYQVRFLDFETDGIRTHEHIALIYNTGTLSYTHRTIAEVVDSINGASGAQPADGWSATPETFDTSGCAPASPDEPDLTPCWLNDERYAAWIEASGIKYSGDAWVYGFDLDCATARTFQAQMLFHQLLYWPPAMDDPLSLSSTSVDETIFLPCATILRGQAVGVVCHESGFRASGVVVTISGGAGSGTTDAQGIYQTGSPYPTGVQTLDVTADVGEDPPTLSMTFHSRVRTRGAFSVVLITAATIYFIYEDWHGMLHAVGVEEGNIRYFRSDSSLPIPDWAVNGVFVTGDADTPGSDDNPVVVRNWFDRLFVLFDRGGDTYESVSDDDGETWSDPTVAIEGGTRPFTITDTEGNHLESAYLGGNIAARIRAQGDEDWSDIFTFNDSSDTPLVVEDAPYSYDNAHDTPGRYVLAVVIDGETATSLWWSADEGRTWTRVS